MTRSAGSTLHATALVLGEAGILIRGESGAGKSSLALALLALDGAGQVARLVGDDRVNVCEANGRLIARGHVAIDGRIEQRGEGIIDIAYEPAAVIRCVVDLTGDLSRDIPPRLPDADDGQAVIEGVVLQRLTLPPRQPAAEAARRVLGFIHRLAN